MSKHSEAAHEINIGPKHKYRRKDEVNWGEEDLTSMDIENLLPMAEAAQEKGEHWGKEDFTSMDIQNLIPLVEAEKEKGQRGGNLWAEPENDIEPEPQNQKVKCPHCSLSLSSRGSLYHHIKVKHSHGHGYICEQCGQGFPRKDYFQRHVAKCEGPSTKVKTRINVEEEPRAVE